MRPCKCPRRQSITRVGEGGVQHWRAQQWLETHQPKLGTSPSVATAAASFPPPPAFSLLLPCADSSSFLLLCPQTERQHHRGAEGGRDGVHVGGGLTSIPPPTFSLLLPCADSSSFLSLCPQTERQQRDVEFLPVLPLASLFLSETPNRN